MEENKMKYLFKTTATMKPYNRRKWWIDGDIVREIKIDASSTRDALQKYRDIVKERDYITISENAIKHPDPMYRDTENGNAVQVGYVITAKCDFEDRDNYKWSTQYIDLWISVYVVSNPFEAEEATTHV